MLDLSSNSRSKLLELARESIRQHISTGDSLTFETSDPELTIKAGCFVTLRQRDSLRGCVGTFEPTKPLYENVLRMACSAAFQDVRFSPVSKEELPGIHIDISVLGEPFKMNSVDEIEIGKHGVLVQYGDRRGTFLPEVAVEQKWNAAEFITFCAREKAGLSPSECGRADVYLYEVLKFSEPS
ncbi:MAG: AmmeMemoRadiSam system protein A [Candidatus Omnitrophota bacterium]|nr:AmmeMemoRadiSam system protein A [Candidatus Omnitrophota bacterium]